MGDKLPFLVEYAKSGRASCKACKTPITKDSVRIAKIVQSPFHDGTMPNWFHEQCFWTKARPQKVEEFANFDNIRWEDQENIRSKIGSGSASADAGSSSSSGKGRKRGAAAAAPDPTTKDYKIEYAKSNRSTCIGCEAPIIKGDMRISRMDFESEKAVQLGGIDRWHHLDCFAKIRDTYEFFGEGTSIPGYNSLGAADKTKVKKALPKMKPTTVPTKKPKVEPTDDIDQDEMRKQNEALFKMRDKLKDLNRPKLWAILKGNSQFVPAGMAELMDHVADQMLFGALGTCEICNGNFVFVSNVGYKCTGDISEWTKCENVVQVPPRVPFQMPVAFQDYEPFADFKPSIGRRIFRVIAPSTSQADKKADGKTGPKVVRGALPLKGMNFVIAGLSSKAKESLRKQIMALGGMVGAKVTETTAAVISNEETIEKQLVVILDAQSHDIQVVTEDFVEEAKTYKDAPITLITKKNIASWGADPSTRVNASIAKSMSHGKSMFDKGSSGKVKIKIKGGGAVDPESNLEDVAHVYQVGNTKYTITLGLTDIQSGINKYYKMQILKHDTQNKYWLFRNWGRIGTKIGGKKLESQSVEECIKQFEHMYFDKTGNRWYDRNNFQKKPGLMLPLEVDVDEEITDNSTMESDIQSKLQQPVQDLVKLIFDVNLMKKVMAEYELDSDKMPLGKLSKTQLQEAYTVLTQLLEATRKANPPKSVIIDASNRFYTLVPHSFGVSNPPLLDSEEMIKTKAEMIDALLEMEIAYSMLSGKTEKGTNPIDGHYARLNANIEVLDRNSDEFRLIEKYAKNTHATTHSSYELVIQEVFVVKRQGEESRYKPFKKLHNKMLLWHGSRTTNFAGILSQGLRIAPPEAPATGYMFGKGIYFADMVSKSANYCCTSSQNSTGLLLLCEVALGNMFECTESHYVEKLPAGKHSTFGMGQTKPDPTMTVKIEGGVEVPCGTPVDSKIKSSLLYDEFIVYDVAQVQVKYLVKMDFKYKY